MKQIVERILLQWHSLKYNFQWPDYVWMIDGWIPRCSMAVPIIGYLIIFNDYVAGNITFHNLIGEQASPLGLSSGSRLRLIYFGLLSLGLSNIIYRIRRPYLMRLGNNQFNFVEKGLKVFTISEYIQFHGDIRQHGHYTMYGKYYDSEWDGFWQQQGELREEVIDPAFLVIGSEQSYDTSIYCDLYSRKLSLAVLSSEEYP